jgi:hypothetical protein
MPAYSLLLAAVTATIATSALAQEERFSPQTFKPKRGELAGSPTASAISPASGIEPTAPVKQIMKNGTDLSSNAGHDKKTRMRP